MNRGASQPELDWPPFTKAFMLLANGRYTPNSGHLVAPQRTPLWAQAV